MSDPHVAEVYEERHVGHVELQNQDGTFERERQVPGVSGRRVVAELVPSECFVVSVPMVVARRRSAIRWNVYGLLGRGRTGWICPERSTARYDDFGAGSIRRVAVLRQRDRKF